jgi:hypothetical protein
LHWSHPWNGCILGGVTRMVWLLCGGAACFDLQPELPAMRICFPAACYVCIGSSLTVACGFWMSLVVSSTAEGRLLRALVLCSTVPVGSWGSGAYRITGFWAVGSGWISFYASSALRTALLVWWALWWLLRSLGHRQLFHCK